MGFAVVVDNIATEHPPGKPLVLSGLQYPLDLFTAWSAEKLAEIGVYEIAEDEPPAHDQRTQYVERYLSFDPATRAVHRSCKIVAKAAAAIADYDAAKAARDAEQLRAQALTELAASDRVAIRCFKAGVPYPKAWRDRDAVCRGIISSGSGVIPPQPAYPVGA